MKCSCFRFAGWACGIFVASVFPSQANWTIHTGTSTRTSWTINYLNSTNATRVLRDSSKERYLGGYSSLGAIVSALIAPFYVWWFKPQFTFPVSMLSCLILLRHHDNIQRLWRRQETKIWTKLKRKKKDAP